MISMETVISPISGGCNLHMGISRALCWYEMSEYFERHFYLHSNRLCGFGNTMIYAAWFLWLPCPAKRLMCLLNVISCLYCILIWQTKAKLVFARVQLVFFFLHLVPKGACVDMLCLRYVMQTTWFGERSEILPPVLKIFLELHILKTLNILLFSLKGGKTFFH